MPVAQDIDALPAQRPRDGIGIHAEIVVAQHRIYPVTRPKPPKKLRRRPDISPGIGDEIPRKRNDVRIQPICLAHGLGKPFLGQKKTVMNVGYLNDAQAVERAGKSIQPDALIIHAEAIAGTPSCGRFQIRASPSSAQCRPGAIGPAIEKLCHRLPGSPEPEM